MVQIPHFFPLVFQRMFYGNLIVLSVAPLSSFQLDPILWQGHALPAAAQIMREMQMPQVSAVGSQRESIWKEESWPIESEVIRRGIIQETVKPKIAANSLNK